MSSSRNPFVDPQPGDVIELRLEWTRTVVQRVDTAVVFDVLFYGETINSVESDVASWQEACDMTTARVIRRGEDA